MLPPNGRREVFSGNPSLRWLVKASGHGFVWGTSMKLVPVLEKQGGADCSSGRVEHFLSIVSNCALLDLEFKGNAFTWTNNQVGDACVRERLDRAMANLEWHLKFLDAQVFHDAILGSDHCLLIVNCDVPLQKVPKYFKFESMWSTHPDCEEVIQSAWDSMVYGSDMYKLAEENVNVLVDSHIQEHSNSVVGGKLSSSSNVISSPSIKSGVASLHNNRWWVLVGLDEDKEAVVECDGAGDGLMLRIEDVGGVSIPSSPLDVSAEDDSVLNGGENVFQNKSEAQLKRLKAKQILKGRFWFSNRLDFFKAQRRCGSLRMKNLIFGA
ncbi:hypothetical protein Vadar_008917 [Vaccinium darrowii]|uniref:Uncharacterized protein n=1 Tax=Vaccinium darrowii TaxID=229202 RepID=A0ACB7YU09_9ERIC|nr:hypothetical protein Vadar_008917 [Vaccinium darrowii]